MRRAFWILLLPALLLSGCTNGAETGFERFRALLPTAVHVTAELRCEYDDRSVSFTLRCDETDEGAAVSVLSPQEIAGVSAKLGEGMSQLSVDGITLDCGDLNDFGLSPVTALPTLLRALREGHAESYWTEGGHTLCDLTLDDHVSAQVTLSETLSPIAAELRSDGRVRVFLTITEWS